MRRLQLASAAAALLVVAPACSHEQKVTQAPTAAPSRLAAAPRPAPAPSVPEVLVERSKNKEGGAIFFDFDSAVLRDEARPVLQNVAESLRGGSATVHVEGNCDELGTVEYNLALGEQRARAAKEYLVHMGVPAEKIATISYGSQRQKYPGHDEVMRAKNRRDDLVVR